LPFSALIVAPNALSRQQICILALLAAIRQQYHQPVRVLAEVDPITRAKINPVLINAGINTLP
jgi:hypothetical protein